MLELAQMVRKIHPDAYILVGGLTASHFWHELLEYTEIDFVMRGDSTEYPLLRLMNVLQDGGNLVEVPNLAWRDKAGNIHTNGLNWVPDNIDDFRTDYSWIIRSAARHLDPVNVLMSIPYRDWLTNPSAAVLTQRGCPGNCLICGGSAHAYQSICNRDRPAVKSPAAVIRDVASAARIMRARIFLGSDMQDPGETYYREVFRRFKALRISNPLVIEVIHPAPFEFFCAAVDAAGRVTLHMSADTHDEALRARFGRKYKNAEMEQMIKAALDAGVRAVRIFFGIGLPGQDAASVMNTVDYCGQLLEQFGGDGRFFPFISVLAPFIEPGSSAFQNPERHGYRNIHSSLKDYQNSMRQRSWEKTIGYETLHMDRATLVETAYRANIALNRLLEESKLITPHRRRREEERLNQEWNAVQGNGNARTRWLVGESSIYTSKVRGFIIKPHAFRPLGILREASTGLRDFLQDLRSGDVRGPWR
jgi:B12-binding domain/radical SAM domain protein